MSYTVGKAKSLEDITLEDALAHTIWEWAFDDEGVEGQDETWQRPIISTDNLTNDIYDAIITLKIKGVELYATATYDNKTKGLEAIVVWSSDEWIPLNEMEIERPVVFVALARINDVSNVEFISNDISVDTASRIK